MNILVTGGAGYLGNILCRKLLNKEHRVRCLDNLYFGKEPIVDLLNNRNFELIQEDIRNQGSVFEALKGIDKVIHLAALVGDPVCESEPNLAFEINWVATTSLVKACKFMGGGQLIFASTCSVYGSIPGKKLTEEFKPSPISIYGRTKLECENIIMGELSDSIIFRMGTLYGYSPRMRFDLLINYFIARAINKEILNVFGGDQARPFIHVDDAAEAFTLAVENENRGTFNLSERNYVIREVAEEIRKLVPGVGVNIVEELKDKRDYQVSVEKLEREFQFKAKKTLKDAIAEIKTTFNKVDYSMPIYNNHLVEVK